MSFKTLLLFLLARLLTWAMGCLPHGACVSLGRLVGRSVYAVLGERARVTLDNLKLIYGDKMTDGERAAFARRVFAHWGSVAFEVLHYVGCPWTLKRYLAIEGLEHLQAVMARGQGAILVCAHLGNFQLVGTALADYFPIKYIFREPSDPAVAYVYRWLYKKTKIQGIADNPRNVCAYQSLQHLRAKGALGILIDQVETGGVFVDFMGQPAGSTIAAAKLAIRTGVPLVPVFCVRQPDKRLRLSVGPEIAVPRRDRSEAHLKEAVATLNNAVEAWVRKYPEQWLWPHRRWRAWRK